MNLAEKIALISIEHTQDDLGEWVEKWTKTEIFGRIESVSMSEFFEAGRQGFKPDMKVTIWMAEYDGQSLLEYKDKTYTIYRSYRRDDGRIELYVNEKKGDEEE